MHDVHSLEKSVVPAAIGGQYARGSGPIHESTDGRIPSRSRNFRRRVKHPVQTRCKTFYRANVKFAEKGTPSTNGPGGRERLLPQGDVPEPTPECHAQVNWHGSSYGLEPLRDRRNLSRCCTLPAATHLVNSWRSPSTASSMVPSH